MRTFSTLIVLRAPPEPLFAVMRDRLAELVGSIDDIKGLEQLERAETDRDVVVVNRWHARQTIPGLVRERLGDGEISWVDRARWSNQDLLCRWSIEPSVGDGAITCVGATSFAPAMAGRGCRVTFEGELAIAPEFIGSLVGPLAGPIRLLVESIGMNIVPSNFRAVAELAAKLC